MNDLSALALSRDLGAHLAGVEAGERASERRAAFVAQLVADLDAFVQPVFGDFCAWLAHDRLQGDDMGIVLRAALTQDDECRAEADALVGPLARVYAEMAADGEDFDDVAGDDFDDNEGDDFDDNEGDDPCC